MIPLRECFRIASWALPGQRRESGPGCPCCLTAAGVLSGAAMWGHSPQEVQLSSVLLRHSGVGMALPALPISRRTAVLDAVDSLAGRLGASSPVLALVLRFRLGLLANPQNFYPAEGADLPFLDEQAAASWLEASPMQDASA